MSRAARRPLRVALVGLGPKGLYALERLIHLARREAPGAIRAEIFEPHPAPGAGPIYDPCQPDYLRMNFAAELIDMWPAGAGAGPSFAEWRAERPELRNDPYAPRAQVGSYLSEGFRRLLEDATGDVDVALHSEAVEAVRPTAGAWALTAAAEHEFDEVLVAVGHAWGWDGALAKPTSPPAFFVPTVFPVEENLGPERVPAGANVAMRGFALTMIDAALALTEGRGGRFTGAGPEDLVYEPSGEEVSRIAPSTRTGRPMLAKPDPAHAIRSAELDALAAEASSAMSELGRHEGLAGAIGVVGRLASASLASVSGAGTKRLDERLEDLARGRPLRSRLGPAEELERSLLVATAKGDPGPDWALGHAWREIYPALVRRLGAGGLDASEWPAFRFLAREMERIAFGPPPVNAAKLLALVRSGRVDLSHLCQGLGAEADVVVDAVIPAPGALGVHHPVLSGLLRSGQVRVPPGRRGLEITADVTCVGADGSRSEGLGAIGRPTEDWVIGNDTLNRELHPQPEAWARRVVAKAAGR